MTATGPLHRADLETFARFGIDERLLTAAGVHRVSHQQARDAIGIRYHSDHLEGIAFPYPDPTSGDLLTYRVRRDHPEIDSTGRPIAKYIAPPDRHRLFFAPGAQPLLADPVVPVVWVESEKSALTLTAAAARLERRLLVIGTGGCCGWKGVIGKTTSASGARVDQKGALPDFDRVVWAGREAVVLFDANATSNANVQTARRHLAQELTQRGARVRIADLPIGEGINGPDDYRAAHDDVALFAVIDRAAPLRPLSATDLLNLAGLDVVRGMSLEDLEDRLRQLKGHLHGADALRRRTVRELLVAKLKAEKVSGAAGLVDAAIPSMQKSRRQQN